MLSIHAVTDEVHPFELGFIRFSDKEKTSETVAPRQRYMMYLGVVGCFECILYFVNYKRSSSYVFEGGSKFSCKIKKDVIQIEYMGFSGSYERSELFKTCHSFLIQSCQMLSSAGYGEHAMALDLSDTAERFQS